MTLRLEDNETVAAVALPEPLRDVREGAFILVDRKRGLLLRSISLCTSEKRVGKDTQALDQHHVA